MRILVFACCVGLVSCGARVSTSAEKKGAGGSVSGGTVSTGGMVSAGGMPSATGGTFSAGGSQAGGTTGTGGVVSTGGATGGATQCNDGIDNDGDGKIDLYNEGIGDPGCTSLLDNKECQRPECLPDWPGAYSACPSSLQSNTTYKFVNCNSGIGIGNTLTNVKFYGSRFASNAVDFTTVDDRGANTTFDTCLFEPSKDSAPPVTYANGYQFAIWKYQNAGLHVIDSEFWGWGNGIQFYGGNPTATQTIKVEGSWFHDARDDGGIDHTDGMLSNDPLSCAVSNPCLIVNNVISSIGNTNGLALQPGSGGAYSNWKIRGNIFSGFGYTVAIAGSSATTGFLFTDNIASTVFAPVYGFLYPHDINFATNGFWRRNKKTGGQFWLPTGSFSGTDYSAGSALACDNGIDDDGDGLIDFGTGTTSDPGCSSSSDSSE